MDNLERVLTDSAPSALSECARERGVTLLHACVSGSQVWGTATSKSDYDVRFIYASPTARYLSLDGAPSVIDVGLIRGADGFALDITGWDIFKALGQLRRGNAQVIEWLLIPPAGVVEYAHSGTFVGECLEVLHELHRPDVLFENYRGQVREHLLNIVGHARVDIRNMLSKFQVSPKALIYMIRGAVNAWTVYTARVYPPANLREALLMPALSEWEGIRYELEDVMAAREAGKLLLTIPPRTGDLVSALEGVPRQRILPTAEALERATARLNEIAFRWISMK